MGVLKSSNIFNLQSTSILMLCSALGFSEIYFNRQSTIRKRLHKYLGGGADKDIISAWVEPKQRALVSGVIPTRITPEKILKNIPMYCSVLLLIDY